MPEGPDHEHDPGDFRQPLPAADRIWRHPSEVTLGASASAAGGEPALGPDPGARRRATTPRRRATFGTALVSGAVGAMATLALLSWTGAMTTSVASSNPTLDSVVVDTVAASVAASGELLRDQVSPALDSVATIRSTSGGTTTLGVVIDVHGHLVTSASTLPAGASYVVDCDGRMAKDVTVLALDTRHDVAVLQLPSDAWPVVAVATGAPRLGDPVVAITAAPLRSRTGGADAADDPAISSGTIDGRELTVTDRHLGTGQRLVRTDAVTDADDGGLLFDPEGELVGLLTGRDDDTADSWTYATPVSVAFATAHRLTAPATSR